ncbi:MAG TPA: BrnT family toxin, partial [Acidisarcina sp.]
MFDFEWNDSKAATNLRNHGVSLDLAKSVFQDMGAVEWFDDRRDYGEERFVIIGIATNATLLVVSYTERAENIRIILREERHLMKKTNISAKISEDVTALSSEAIERAARLDPDAL